MTWTIESLFKIPISMPRSRQGFVGKVLNI